MVKLKIGQIIAKTNYKEFKHNNANIRSCEIFIKTENNVYVAKIYNDDIGKIMDDDTVYFTTSIGKDYQQITTVIDISDVL